MENLANLQNAVAAPLNTLYVKLMAFLPNLAGAIFMLVAGYFIAKLISVILGKLLEKVGLNKLSKTAGITTALDKSGVKTTPAAMIGVIIFWIIMLTFIISAADALGLERVSATIDDFVLYLPKVIGAALVLLIGLLVAHFVRTGVRSAAEGMNLGYAKPLGTVIYGIMVVICVTLAIGQLEIETKLLNQVVSILIFAVASAIALSLGLGTRDISSNIIAGVYARDIFPANATVKVGDISGNIVEVGSTKTQIRTNEDGIVSVSNRLMLEEKVTITSN
ncbi:MAG: mechanosensitive ion channel [Gammaproteobacteria bacterium]|nr:mechanosensitive ion channel [Gammaproteobacteria bacterium]